jgi:murein DD-endopeptidase MepM/ murein hydrolase activator NlpD
MVSSGWRGRAGASAALAVVLVGAGPVAAHAVVEAGAAGPSVVSEPAPAVPFSAATGGIPYGTYRWPVHGAVIRPFEPPANQFSAGHRGIDIAAPFGTPIRAPADGIVSFAGAVAGSLFISIDHAAGIRTSYSWVSDISVTKGQVVRAGEVIGKTGQGHPGSDRTHLHFSVRLDGTYIDPMLLLGGGNLDDLIHLAPN